MNKAYKVIWSKVKGCYVVVSELAKERGKNNSRGKHALLAGIVMGTLLGGAFLPAGTVLRQIRRQLLRQITSTMLPSVLIRARP